MTLEPIIAYARKVRPIIPRPPAVWTTLKPILLAYASFEGKKQQPSFEERKNERKNLLIKKRNRA